MIPWDAVHTSSIPPYLSLCLSVCVSLPLPRYVFVSVFVSLLVDLFPILFLSLSVFLFIHFLPPPSPFFCLPPDRGSEQVQEYEGAASETNTIRKMQINVRAVRSFPLFARLHQIKQHLRPLVQTCIPFPYVDATNDLACITSAIQFIHFTAVPRVLFRASLCATVW